MQPKRLHRVLINRCVLIDEIILLKSNKFRLILTLEEVSPININIADAETLMLLPHVNQEIAEKIIEFREHTEFSNEYELLLIDGLSQNEVSDMLDYITT